MRRDSFQVRTNGARLKTRSVRMGRKGGFQTYQGSGATIIMYKVLLSGFALLNRTAMMLQHPLPPDPVE